MYTLPEYQGSGPYWTFIVACIEGWRAFLTSDFALLDLPMEQTTSVKNNKLYKSNLTEWHLDWHVA